MIFININHHAINNRPCYGNTIISKYKQCSIKSMMSFSSITDGIDYILMPTDLSFPVGSQRGARQCMTLNITDDAVVENQESFYVRLTTNDTRIEIFRLRGRQALQQVCINDNDSK